MNKWHLIEAALGSTLNAEDKNLLVELIARTNFKDHGNWDCWPSVERLCRVRGMKHEKNFKGVEFYLPGLVTKRKLGRNNRYTLNPEAIMALPQYEVNIKHTPNPYLDTPALEGVNTPALAENTPALAENTPCGEGANSTSNNKEDSTEDSTDSTSADAPVLEQELYSTRESEEETIALPVSTRPIESIAVLPSFPLAELESASARAVPTPVGRPPGMAVDVFAEERELVRLHNLMKSKTTNTNKIDKIKETVEW